MTLLLSVPVDMLGAIKPPHLYTTFYRENNIFQAVALQVEENHWRSINRHLSLSVSPQFSLPCHFSTVAITPSACSLLVACG